MLDRWFRTACCAALALALASALPARAADDNFTVSGVHEDVTAVSALAARDQALAQGQQQAFDTLMSRLVPNNMPPTVTPDQLTDLIASFQVANEQTSSVRYVADYTFHFKPAAVRRLLQQVGTSLAPRPAPAVVLPVFRSGSQTVLWDDPNPWRDAWADHISATGPMRLLVPVGDLTDVSLIDVPKALSGDQTAIRGMSARHQNDDVMVALAERKDNPTRLNITVTRYSAAGTAAPQSLSLIVTQHPGESLSDFWARAVGYTIFRLGQSWQSANAANPVTANTIATLEIRVPVASLADWVVVRGRLQGVPAVRSVDLVSFGDNQIRIAIRYAGGQDQLRAALAAAGLDLAGSDPDWTLTMRPTGAAPPDEDQSPPAPPVEPNPEPSAAPSTAPGMPPPGDDGGGNLGALRKGNGQP